MALFLFIKKGHGSLVTPFVETKTHNCANLKFEQQKRYPTDSISKYGISLVDSSDSIIFEDYQDLNGSQIVKNATIMKLVERLTNPKCIDNDYLQTFMITFRSFCSPLNLFNLITQKFNNSTTFDKYSIKNYNDSLYCWIRDEYKLPVQKRILQIIYFWICNHPYDFTNNHDLLTRLSSFLNGNLHSIKFTMIQRIWCAKIKKALDRKLQNHKNSDPVVGIQRLMSKGRKRRTLQSKFSIYLYINSKSELVDFETFWRLKPSKVAKQLTLIHYHLLNSIEPIEFLETAWISENRYEKCPHLLKMIEFSTKMTYWIVRSIVEENSIQKRAEMISKILEIAQECLDLNNYNAFVELFSALNHSAIFRLKKTKMLLEEGNQALMDTFQSLFDPHWKQLSNRIRNCSTPCIPFIGVYLSQLVFIENGRPTIVDKNIPQQLISFRKCRKVASVIREIQRFQQNPYFFKVETNIIKFLLSINPETGFNKKNLENYLYKRSSIIEPQGSKFQY